MGINPLQDDRLWAVQLHNPSAAVDVLFRSRVSGKLLFEVFDVAGRRLHHREQFIEAGEIGRLKWPGPAMSGVLLYRLKPTPKEGPPAEVRGKLVMVR